VIEMGMNHPGEIAVLARIAAPTLAMVNNAQREHQEFMHTVEAVARENGAVIRTCPPMAWPCSGWRRIHRASARPVPAACCLRPMRQPM
jgi:hypothetical protein